MRPFGGTELLYNNLIKYCGQEWQQYVNLIISVCNFSRINAGKKNILWQHLSYDQAAISGMQDPEFTSVIDSFVYVSNWQLSQFKLRFDIDNLNNYVIKNAIPPLEYKEKPTDKIRLIYTSMPNRGLEVLIDAFKILNRTDVELVVYSSNIIYGTGYANSVNHDYLFHKCKTTPGIVYKGYATNKAIRSAVQSSHILAYPSIFEETSCLAAIEAGAAGCKIVTTDFGALPETCDNWATYVAYDSNYRRLAESYAEALANTIDNYNASSYNLASQSLWFNQQYSWENRAKEWTKFFGDICVE